jgi:hypothetical protein
LKAGEQKKVDVYYLTNISLDYDSCAIRESNAETKSLQAWLEILNKYEKETSRIPLGTSLSGKQEAFQKWRLHF